MLQRPFVSISIIRRRSSAIDQERRAQVTRMRVGYLYENISNIHDHNHRHRDLLFEATLKNVLYSRWCVDTAQCG